ncbi:hypothetical protein [Nocardia africana]
MSEPRGIELTGVDGSRWAVGGPIEGGKDFGSVWANVDNSYVIPNAVLDDLGEPFDLKWEIEAPGSWELPDNSGGEQLE